ncbi:hypothetical protein ELC73_27905, partial [Klebsiella pneumoniae]|nr:hypothetical protein [Klebsiella pneumoniae]
MPPRLDIAAKFTTEARYAGFFDADNRYYGKYSTNYVFYCLSVLVSQSLPYDITLYLSLDQDSYWSGGAT